MDVPGVSVADVPDSPFTVDQREAMSLIGELKPLLLSGEGLAAIQAILTYRRAAVLAEREACAKVADSHQPADSNRSAGYYAGYHEADLAIAAAIRARGN